jgi:hypothetical protein
LSYSAVDLRLNESDLEHPESIAKCVNDWLFSDISRRFERSQNWSESVHFFAGNQWVKYVAHTQRFETIPITDSNRMIERPVTNYFLRWIIVNTSGFTNKPIMIVDPANSDDPKAKTSAKISDVALDMLWAEHEKDDQYYEAALWGTLCGPVFRKSAKIPSGKYYGDAPLYTVKPEIVPPFHIIFDGVPSRFADIGTIMQASVMRIDDVKKMFGKDSKGYYAKNAEEVEPEEISSIPVSIYEGLKNIVPGESSVPYSSSAGGNYLDSCIVKEVYVRPSYKHPKGQMIVVAGNQTVYADDSPYFYLEGKFWHPYTMWNYFKMPGSIWGIGLGPQLVKIQRRINSIDALIAYNRKTMAVPLIWNPKGSGVPAGVFIGMPGQVIDYQESPNGRRPERDQGIPLPPQIIQERQMLLEDGDKIAMSADVRSGDNPRGVNTVGQLQILTEQSELSKSKQTDSWEKFIEDSEYLDLLNFRDCNKDVADPSVIEKLKSFAREVTRYDWNTFTGNDIQENVNIRVEKGSTVNRSRLLMQDTILKLATEGLLPEVMQGSYERKKFLEKFGLSDLFSDANIDEKYCDKAIEMMLDGQYPPVIKGVHNPDIQLPCLLRFMKDPKYLELNDSVKVLFSRRQEELTALLSEAVNRAGEIGKAPMGPTPNPNQMHPAQPMGQPGQGAPQPAAAGAM